MRQHGIEPDDARTIILDLMVAGGAAGTQVSWQTKYETAAA
jgi:hypothetical protein